MSEKIKSQKSEELYYQYFLNSETETVTKLEYTKQGTADMELYKLNSKVITSQNQSKSLKTQNIKHKVFNKLNGKKGNLNNFCEKEFHFLKWRGEENCVHK